MVATISRPARRVIGTVVAAVALSAAGLSPTGAFAQTSPAPTPTPAPAPGSALVARYSFDGGISAGRIAELSGRGSAATVRSTDNGAITVGTVGTGRYVAFPAACPAAKSPCPRAILEAPNDADLNPGTRRFRWAATIRVLKTQLSGSSNVVQKGVVNSESEWKMQLGQRKGMAQCVVVGRGTPKPYIARSTATVADGKWHRVQCERNGTQLTVTVDGVLRGRIAIPSTLTISNDRPLRIGGPNFSNTRDLYHGWLDEVAATLG